MCVLVCVLVCFCVCMCVCACVSACACVCVQGGAAEGGNFAMFCLLLTVSLNSCTHTARLPTDLGRLQIFLAPQDWSDSSLPQARASAIEAIILGAALDLKLGGHLEATQGP